MAEQGIGIDLSKRFYETLVAPRISALFPGLPYAAARIGLGSEALGYDTTMSADHDYGPCVQLFLPPDDFDTVAGTLMQVFDETLPETFEGWQVRYPTVLRPPPGQGVGMLGSTHGIEFYTLGAWSDRFLGRRFESQLLPIEWLSYPEHLFLIVTGGKVFRDDLFELSSLRDRLSYFPRDVWLYKLAAQWGRVAEERAYVGRTGSVGDELGSRVVAGRMVGNLMRLAMLIDRRYAPYPKWFGSAFARLESAAIMKDLLTASLDAGCWEDREERLFQACETLAHFQLEKGVPGASKPIEGRLHTRPFRFVDTVAISDGIRAAIEDQALRQMTGFGGVDQFLGNFVLAVPDWSRAAAEPLLSDGLKVR